MATKRAKTLDNRQFEIFLEKVRKTSDTPSRDRVMILLSYKAGLRAQEIAGLDWEDVTDADGEVREDAIFIPSDIGKGKKERTVPIHPLLRAALQDLRRHRPDDEAVIYGLGRRRMSPVATRVWFHRLYEDLSLGGCSSHSGRRTFITNLARKAGQHECSIRDVQMLAGHASLSTTERYIEASPHVSRLVASI